MCNELYEFIKKNIMDKIENNKIIRTFLKKSQMSFDIELTSKCNAKCVMCPRDEIERENWTMEKDKCMVLADNLANFYCEYGDLMGGVNFAGMGENLLSPYLMESMEYLNEKKNYKLPFTILTNAIALTEKKIAKLKTFKNLNLLISFQGENEFQYEQLTKVPAKVPLKNIKNAINSGLKINIIFVGLKNVDAVKVQKFWRDSYQLRAFMLPVHSRGNNLKNEELLDNKISPLQKRMNCGVYRSITFISSDGNVLPCCHDIKQENKLGNVFNDSLEKIMVKKAKLYSGNKLLPFEICKKCDQYQY